jgi:hypothetical protein
MLSAILPPKAKSFTTPDLGWWDSIEHFNSGRSGFGGVTKDKVFARYPDLQMFASREEAMAAAREAGLI